MNVLGTDTGTIQISAPWETTVMPEVFVKRLRRLLVLRYQASTYLDEDDVRLLDRCIYATFCDCREAGAEESARHFLEVARTVRV
jgi:hypothetical protein